MLASSMPAGTIALTMTLRLPLKCTITYVVNARMGAISCFEVSERWAQTMRINRL